jgi:putative transposase
VYKLDRTNNAVFSLVYHLIVTVKYRKQVFTEPSMISDLKSIFEKIAQDFEVEIIEQECGVDHVHVLFRAKPTLDLTKFMNILKGHSSRAIRKKYRNFLKDKLWGDSFWSPSYFLTTTGNVTIDILKQYVEQQRREQD